MLTPLLIIGLGGSGGKTIRSMKQALHRKLESARYEGGLPDAWQFLQIDTTYDGVAFPAPMLPKDEFHCVVPDGSGFYDVLASITNRGTVSDQHKMLAGWGVRNSAISIQAGAGQIRAIGRQVGVADSAKTLQAIKNAISKMQAPTAIADLRDVAKALRAEVPQNATPQAFIISSIAGGSGAGMFMDVAELLKRATAQNWAQEAISFLYTAEVFSSIGAAGKDVSKNSLGAMNELIASKWVGISERSETLYSKLGLVAGNSAGKREYGCKGNFLIGARNDQNTDIRVGVDGEGMDEVFLTVGEALAGAISNDDISEFLYQRAFVNVTQTASALDISGLAPESVNVDNPTLAAAGIGFGQMTLGADRIVEYVADSMAKVQIEKLLWPELTTALMKNGVSIKELIQEKSAQAWPNFLVDSGLDERGAQNQIIDALLPDQLHDRVKQYVAGIIKRNISATPKPIATFSKAVWSDWETESDAFLRTLKIEMGNKAEKWVPEIQNHLRELIARELMLNGYAVITNLAERLRVELKEHVIPELNREHTEFANAVAGFDQRVFGAKVSEIADGLTGVSTQNGPFFEKLSGNLNRVIEFQVNSYVNNLASSLIEDMLNFFVEPLIKQLTDARETLQMVPKAENLASGAKNPYKNFPDWGSGIVPNRYKSRTIERVLIDFSDYESTYDFYASKDSSGAPAFQQSVSASLLGKKMNPMPGDPNIQRLITVNSPWITSVRDAQGSMGAAANKSDWKFHTDLAELSENNRRWLKNEDSSFGKFTDMSIRAFVSAESESAKIRADREAKFVREYDAMLKIAAPLVLLNPRASEHVIAAADGGNALRILVESNKIPFDISSNVGQLCTVVLQQRGYNPSDPGFASKWFNAGSNASQMFAASTHMASLPAWTFASLTEPILEQVAQSKNKVQTWDQFWDGRRSRPLVEAIPFETEMRRSIITGWFIARLFGMGVVEVVPTGRTAKVWNPTLQVPGWSTFSSPLISTAGADTRRESWILPQLLVSAGIALAEFGKSGSPEFINGYRLLKFLGREVTTSFENRDHWDGKGSGDMLPTGMTAQSQFIKDWVQNGTKPAPTLDLLRLLQENISTSSDRGAALIATVETLRAEYSGIWNDNQNTAWNDLSETWELREDIDLALSDIGTYVAELHINTSSTSD
jgi:hypothetical protein